MRSRKHRRDTPIPILRVLRYLCIIIVVILASRPLTEDLIIRAVFGPGLNIANTTYVPATFNYMRPGKIYTFKRPVMVHSSLQAKTPQSAHKNVNEIPQD
ncbi:hypothetical transcript [Echinococcus multilocularis]|uniref:Hypothetical transcript n=1 Tax=Echinococcus multilocularis TaxID=6211 RepID=A0A068YEH1_ECHMU|nr:hypothetical transcript [Echinococcus multilocularis]